MRSTLLILLFAASVSAEDHFVHSIDMSRVSIKRDIAYRNELKFDLYRPTGNAVVPIVIFANRLSADFRTWPGYIGWAQYCAANGLAGVLYQANEDEATVDFDALVAALKTHASESGVDASRIVVWSGSTNVLLGLPVAMDPARDYIRGAVVYYGSAPVDAFRRDVPLLLVRAGLDSPELDQSIDALIPKAFAANAPWTIENYSAGVHAFDLRNDNDVSRAIIERTIAFIHSSLKLSAIYASQADAATTGAAFNRGDWPAAVAGYRRLTASDPNDGEAHRRLGIALLESNQFDEALRELERAYELGRQGIRDTVYRAARAAAGARNVERTLYWLEMALNSRFGPPVDEVRSSPAFAPVRDDPRFQQLLMRQR